VITSGENLLEDGGITRKEEGVGPNISCSIEPEIRHILRQGKVIHSAKTVYRGEGKGGE